MSQSSDPASRIYKPHSRYRWMALGSVLLSLLLGWNLFSPVFRTGHWSALPPDVGTIFFILAAIGIALWQGRMALSRVELTATSVSLSAPFSRIRIVDFRQISSVSESGRAGRVITLIYHPVGPNQLVDVDDLDGLALPEVIEQDSLLERLEECVPT